MTLQSISKTDEMDQGVFTFSLYPPLFNINQIVLSDHVTLDCDATFTVSSFSYYLGVLSLKADYTTDME